MLLRNTLFFVAAAAVAATQVPALLERSGHAGGDTVSTPLREETTAQPVALEATEINGTVALKADGSGHYNGVFRINGKSVEGLVDTGATYVAVNESTARRLGFSGNGLNFQYAANTANGRTEAALVTLDRVEIGSIRVRDVEAFVLRDKALSSTLVGMSFLQKLSSYRVENGILQLKK